MIKKIFLLFILVTVLAFLFNSCCFAQRELEIEYPEVPGVETPTVTRTVLTEFIKYIFTFAIVLAGLLAFGALIYGGIRYLTSAGDPTKMSDGKNQVIAGFLGLIILLSSYLILNTINPQLILKETPAIESLEQGIYAFVKLGCADDPEDFFDDPVSISQNSPDLSIVLPRDANGVPQSLKCIQFRSGEEELTVKVCSGTDFGEPCAFYEGNVGEIKNVTGQSIKFDYHLPGVYLYASDNCTGDDYKIYQSGSATLPEFDNKTNSIKFIYDDKNPDTGEYGIKYAVILHEKENFMGKAAIFDQDQNICLNLSDVSTALDDTGKSYVSNLIGISSCEAAPAVSCSETDRGKDYYKKGTCTGTNGSFTDYCEEGTNTLKEYYCSPVNEQCYLKTYDCETDPTGNTKCEDGACVKPGETCDQEVKVVDYDDPSQGLQYMSAGVPGTMILCTTDENGKCAVKGLLENETYTIETRDPARNLECPADWSCRKEITACTEEITLKLERPICKWYVDPLCGRDPCELTQRLWTCGKPGCKGTCDGYTESETKCVDDPDCLPSQFCSWQKDDCGFPCQPGERVYTCGPVGCEGKCDGEPAGAVDCREDPECENVCSWQDDGCGIPPCGPEEMHQTCGPEGCTPSRECDEGKTRCKYDPDKCPAVPPPPPPSGYGYGADLSGGVSSITVYLKPVGGPIGPGVKFWGDKNYTKEKDDVETIYYGDGGTVTNLEIIDADNKITSMEMDGHYVALLFDKENYQGGCEVFMASCPDFRSHRIGQCGWLGRSDCLSSFIVKARK